jgi:hypothetical protein
MRALSVGSKMRIISGDDLMNEPESAQRLAETEPVFVVENGKTEYVLMTIEEYRQRGGKVPLLKVDKPDKTV